MIKIGALNGERLTAEQIKEIVSHDNDQYREYKKYYESKNSKLYDVWARRNQAQVSPNNFAPSGYARYIVNTMTGYIASPGYVEYSSDNEDYIEVIKKVNKVNKEPTVTNQEVRESGIQGRDFELHFLQMDDNDQVVPRFVSVPGNECYPIYTSDIAPELQAVIRRIRTCEDSFDIWVYYSDVIRRYKLKGESITSEGEEVKHGYNKVPWNIGRNNIDYKPDFEDVITYIDIIDAIQTNTLNALDKNGRATILTSMPKSEELAKDLRDLNMIFDMNPGDDGDGKDFFEYVNMELNPDLREHMLDHFINELHKISGIFDFTKLDLGQDPSGTALQYRIYPMELKASEKVSYRLEFLRRRYDLITQIVNNYTITGGFRVSDGNIDDLDITMKRNLPANVKAILEENMLMSPYIDKRTLIERIPGIDPDKVEDRMLKGAVDDPFGDMSDTLATGADKDGAEVGSPDAGVQLNGAQVTAATGIVKDVAAGLIPRQAGKNSLMLLFNLSDSQAEMMLAGVVEGSIPETAV